MLDLHPQYIIDTAGKKMVILQMKEFKTIIEELEELDDIKLYDKTKASKDTLIPIEDAFKQIEGKRSRKK